MTLKVTGNYVKFPCFVLLPTSEEANTWVPFFLFNQWIIIQLLDLVFVISRITKVLIRVISLTLQLRLITLTSTLIILDITKTSFSNCLYIIIIYKIICHQTMTSFPYAADLKKYYFVSTQLHWWCQQDLEVISSKLTVLKRLKMVLLEYDHLWEYKQTFSFKIVVWLVGNL